jgi:hypothetical protein
VYGFPASAFARKPLTVTRHSREASRESEVSGLGERFSMLTVLSEKKGKILGELDEAIAVRNEQHETARQVNVVEWPELSDFSSKNYGCG